MSMVPAQPHGTRLRVWSPTRRSAPTGRARGDWLVNQLPLGLLEDTFLVRFVRIFQDLATVYLDHIDGLGHQLDPSVAPPSMVRFLGRWLGVQGIDPSLPDERQRAIVQTWSKILAWRGTRRGLQTLLELVSGAPVVIADTAGVFREDETPADAGLVTIRVESSGWATEQDLIDIVRSEIPAGARVDLRIGDRIAWTTETPPTAIATTVRSFTATLPGDGGMVPSETKGPGGA